MRWVVVTALVIGSGMSALRWLRIAQREHYLAGTVTRFSLRWWFGSLPAALLAVVAGVATVVTGFWEPAALVVAAVEAAGPPGLSLRGTTSSLAWTPRLKRVAIGVGLMIVAGGAAGIVIHPVVTAVMALLLPLIVDLVLGLLAPLESRLGEKWVNKASEALADSGATVVAITGSYGKTSTKGYVAHLLGEFRSTLASPASFNNRMGLARTINEHLSGGVEVFVAEMGTYGPGEIAEMCSWIRPDVAVITAIGPVHLERFGSIERIVAAKSEILEGARVAVLNVDDPHLAELAGGATPDRIIRVGAAPGLDVTVAPDRSVTADGRLIGTAPSTAHPTNLACALGVALALEVDPTLLEGRLLSLAEPDHRRTVVTGTSGVRIIDDTFNSNPAGARAALVTLAAIDVPGRRVVVTPGMVELGPIQKEENRAFGAGAAAVADLVIIVGRTNRAALSEGAAQDSEVMVVDDRTQAVEWVRANLGADDAVLYENDLPDHYP